MSKRKLENQIVSNIDSLNKINNEYYNELNCDSIKIINNDNIIFRSSITRLTIDKLFECIYKIIESSSFNHNENRIYIHITSKGGTLDGLYDFISIKNKHLTNIELVSIIEHSCTDAGFMLASLCDYRFIKKNIICYMSVINNNNNFWNIYNQGENLLDKLLYIIYNIKLKVTKEKFLKYINQNNIWNAKKMVKIGFVDEII